MTYWGINAIFLAVAVLVLGAALVKRRPGRVLWGAMCAAGALLFVLTAVFDNILIASGIISYAVGQVMSGVQIGLAPLEDFAYPLAGLLLLPALWLLLGGRVGAPAAARSAHRHERASGDA